MKKLIRLTTICSIALVFASNILAQADAAAIKNNLTSIFSLSKAKTFEKAAELIAYEGDDQARNMKDSYNPANKDEVNQAKRICKKVSALMDLSSSYDFGAVTVKNDGGTETYLIDVNFVSGSQKLVTSFSFVKTTKGYLLSNVN